ncbi:MAG TPA: hypothetical protein VGR06_04455 [Actinophytocola sp.]|jgi:hypothetical protein|uniref:Rv0361 family membrane protein n=1 Tax=Actinophytocola sp. TaxID=1872138 RepID=UPI002E0A6967|nr:hypothetical protein [Actinophytocola sp.]
MSYQQPPYGQQPGPYGQPNWGPPGWGAPPPPKKPRTGLIVSLIIVVVLVLGGGGVGIYFLAKGSDNPPEPGASTGTPAAGGDPERVANRYAELYAEAVNSDLEGFDVRDFKPLMCAKDYDNVRRETDRTLRARETSHRKPSPRPEAQRVTIGVKDVKVNGDHGTFKLTRKEPGSTSSPRDLPLDLQRDGDNWRVCGLYKDSPSTSRPPTPSTSRRLPPLTPPSS